MHSRVEFRNFWGLWLEEIRELSAKRYNYMFVKNYFKNQGFVQEFPHGVLLIC